jgi:exosortase/archaeosortase family protein
LLLPLLPTRLPEATLLVGGALVTREGNIIGIGGRQIEVVEACCGIRYILSLGFVAVVFAYSSDAKPWMRVALLAASVPVARVTVTMRDCRLILAPVLLIAQAPIIQWAVGSERAPMPPALWGFPPEFSVWKKLQDDPITADVGAPLHADRLLSRT